MGHKLPQIPGKFVVKIFVKCGWAIDRIKGSHYILTKAGEKANLSIPVRKNIPLKHGLLRDLIKDANFSQEEFLQLYNNL